MWARGTWNRRWTRGWSKMRTRATTFGTSVASAIRKRRCGRWSFPPRRSTRASCGGGQGGTPYDDVDLNYLAIVLAELGTAATVK